MHKVKRYNALKISTIVFSCTNSSTVIALMPDFLCNILCNILLQGSEDLSLEGNKKVFDCVFKCIYESGRFDHNHLLNTTKVIKLRLNDILSLSLSLSLYLIHTHKHMRVRTRTISLYFTYTSMHAHIIFFSPVVNITPTKLSNAQHLIEY